MAEYTLLDYHKATEFSDYAKEHISHSEKTTQLRMDTSYADQLYKIHRLIEELYPLAIAAALLLGGVLPGLIVLHSSKEISILGPWGSGPENAWCCTPWQRCSAPWRGWYWASPRCWWSCIRN